MKKEKDWCIFPLCKAHAVRNGFCVRHAVFFAGARPKKDRKPILKKAIDLKLKKN